MVALYATPSQPLLSAQLIGFARGPNPKDDAPGSALSFWPAGSSRHGPVLAIRQGDGVISFLPSYL